MNNSLTPPEQSGTEAPPAAAARTGRRRVTREQLEATAGLTGRFAAVSKWRVLAAFKAAAAPLGLSKGLVLIDALMADSYPQDWDGQSVPLVWPSNLTLCERMGIEQSRLSELLRWAINAGLILPRDHGSRRRFGRRDEGTGRIVYGYGFNLSPLAERMGEFEQAAAETRARLYEARQLRGEISALRAATLDLAALGLSEGVPGLDWEKLKQAVTDLAKGARGQRYPSRLMPLRIRLERLQEQAKAVIKAFQSVDNGSQLPENQQCNTSTNTSFIDKSIASDDRCPAPERRGGQNRSSPNVALPRGGSPLRGFPISPAVIMQIAPTFRELVDRANPSWNEVQEAAHYVRGELGISPHAYGQACVVLGRIEAATAVAAISAKHLAGLVRSPGGLLRHMVSAHQNGALQLDRTLLGLLDKAGRGHRRSAKVISPQQENL
jgi:replication initiation protein RepC